MGFEHPAQVVKAASYPPLPAHGISCNLVRKDLLQYGLHPRMSHLKRFTPATRPTNPAPDLDAGGLVHGSPRLIRGGGKAARDSLPQHESFRHHGQVILPLADGVMRAAEYRGDVGDAPVPEPGGLDGRIAATIPLGE